MQDPTAFQVQPLMMKPHFPEEQEQRQIKCPRCDSTNTKFCYYNNYNLLQPRHFCKNCRRYWTKGGALRNIPVGGSTRKSHKRPAKRATSSPSPSISHANNTITNVVPGSHDLTRVGVYSSGGQDPGVTSTGGSFSSLLTSSGHFGTFLEGLNSNGLGLNSNGPGLKMLQLGEIGGNLGSGLTENSGSGLTLDLGAQGNGGGSEGFLALQNGDSSCWNDSHGWSDLAI